MSRIPDQRFKSPEWHPIAECPDCGWRDSQWDADKRGFCPQCGENRGAWVEGTWDWDFPIVRWVSQSKWWKPLTWGRGYFQVKSEVVTDD